MKMLVPPTEGAEIPAQVAIARLIDWGVSIDAFLVDAARVGTRFAASVYLDRSGASVNGMTIATPPVYPVMTIQGFEMVRSVCGSDYYVIVSRLSAQTA
ncbi:hypothetical protein V2I49_07500 [Pseudomonas viridiflava]|uniref:hypothetical protein n=1 Tax=Pseudomonas viridiflava TaxID=33069 RepID=UPI002EAE9667|nr:hypothetical protein [Pseudomonas viridiflava]